MKLGMNLMEMAAELQRQQTAKHDYVAPTKRMHVEMAVQEDPKIPAEPQIVLDGVGAFPLTQHAQGQLASHLEIPRAYFDRMKAQAPTLLENNINTWLGRSGDKRMIRTLDGQARAYFSDRYKVMDADELFAMVYPVLKSAGVQIESLDLTKQKFYLKVTSPTVQAEITKGDIVQAGVIISTSEIGMGAQTVQPFVKRLVCVNGLIVAADYQDRKLHLGKRVDTAEEAQWKILADDTKAAIREGEYKRIRDIVTAFLEGKDFQSIVSGMRQLAEYRIEAEPVDVVERVAERFGLFEDEKTKVLQHLLRGDGDLTAWGLLNAVTRTAEDVESYDRASELEEMGGKILTLKRDEWKVLSAVAAVA